MFTVLIGLFDIVVRKILISRTINEMFLLTPFVSSTNEYGPPSPQRVVPIWGLERWIFESLNYCFFFLLQEIIDAGLVPLIIQTLETVSAFLCDIESLW